MATKEGLIRMLQNAKEFEEKAIPILHDKCLACLMGIRQSDEMIEEDKNKMRQMLNELVSDSREHLLELEELMEIVKRRNQNEF